MKRNAALAILILILTIGAAFLWWNKSSELSTEENSKTEDVVINENNETESEATVEFATITESSEESFNRISFEESINTLNLSKSASRFELMRWYNHCHDVFRSGGVDSAVRAYEIRPDKTERQITAYSKLISNCSGIEGFSLDAIIADIPNSNVQTLSELTEYEQSHLLDDIANSHGQNKAIQIARKLLISDDADIFSNSILYLAKTNPEQLNLPKDLLSGNNPDYLREILSSASMLGRCQLGEDCSAQGELMLRSCTLMDEWCGYNLYDHYATFALSPSAMADVELLLQYLQSIRGN